MVCRVVDQSPWVWALAARASRAGRPELWTGGLAGFGAVEHLCGPWSMAAVASGPEPSGGEVRGLY